MDWRVILVLSPVIIALTWALFNIGAAALNQAQQFLKKES
ncbi:photosystem II protein Y [Gloeocapsa sp. PCC 73106]|nr:photosystem II protein Y [Gloeocapsa sp. PCC 73106]ELR99245.1 Photosystem II protein Y (PsbY) [Gloeocapsa sp. PCC 73106]